MDKTIIIIALFLFSSCSSQKENQEHNSIYSYADLKEYSTTITRREDFLTLPLEYVELETTDNSLVGYVERIVVNDSLIYIKSDGSLHLFERNGKFRNSIGRVGQGPKEVISIFDFAVDAENQEVYILDLQGQKINVYKNNNTFLRSIPCKEEGIFRHVEIYKGEVCLTYMNLMGNEVNKFRSTDKEGNTRCISANDVKFESLQPFAVSDCKTMQQTEIGLLVRQNFNDTIYTYRPEKDEVTLRYAFDFDDLKLSYELLRDLGTFKRNEGSIAYIPDITETNKHVFVDMVVCKRKEKYIIDKNTKTFFQPQHLEKGLYIENGAHYFWPKYYTNEIMIDFLPADYLMEKKEEITHPLLKSIVERMEEDSNPVLMLCRE